MPASVIDLKKSEDLRDVIHHGVAALADGKIVALPTETVYGIAASALNADAVQRLADLKGRDSNKPFAFAVKSADDALDYAPNMSVLARRLARRCWPGPLTLVLDNLGSDSVIHRLPDVVKEYAIPTGSVGLRVPAHDVTLNILRLLAGPIVLTSANISGEEPATSGEQVQHLFGDKVDLILDDGACHFGKSSSVVKVGEKKIDFLRNGVFQQADIEKMCGFLAVIVCTGNTCRSPMGEALLKKIIATKIGCEIADLPERGVTVISAGVAAMSGGSAAPQAMEVMEGMGLNIEHHSSQPFTPHLAQFADVTFTLTNGHRRALLSQWPELESRTHTVRRDGGDIADPIGMPVDVYQKCAEQIETNLAQWVDVLDLGEKITCA